MIAARPGVKLLHVGADRDLSFYEGLDATLVAEAEAELVSCTGLFDDDVETPEDYRALLRAARRRAGCTMVCANPDLVVERGDRLIYCAGALARLYDELGGEAILVGKPHAPIYDAAKKQRRRARRRHASLAVGDGLPTDIRGAVDNGVPVLFVTGGIHAADFGPHRDPDGERVAARLQAEGLARGRLSSRRSPGTAARTDEPARASSRRIATLDDMPRRLARRRRGDRQFRRRASRPPGGAARGARRGRASRRRRASC